MRIIKRHSLLKPVTNYVIDAPQPANISYWWNVGSLLGLSLGIQIITGVTLAMHYNPSVLEAFNSVEHIMRDVNNGWLIRYLHSNAASAFFFLVYLHIGRGLYYGSYKAPRTLVWTIGTTIFILMMATAFLGYVLPYGQMSLWGATVITNLLSAIPWIGQDIVEFVWGGFSVNNATLNRFFSLHFVLPFIIATLAMLHLVSLHDTAGSGNPLGISGNYDRAAFAPYFIFKDLITIFIFMWALSVFVFFVPNVLGDSENYVMANPMQTPPAIVPEWYLLPFYAILRSIPNKLIGVIAMFSAILIILAMTSSDIAKLRGLQYKPFNKTIFFTFIGNLLLLMVLGAKHVESPFIEFGQIATLAYFAYFLVVVPFNSLFEVSASDTYLIAKDTLSKLYDSISETKDKSMQNIAHGLANSRLQSMPIGKQTWVIPGMSCPQCVTKCRLINVIDITTLFSVITVISALLITSKYLPISPDLLEHLTFNSNVELLDAPRPWGLYFQDSASPQMEALVELHDNIMFYLVIILFSVGWIIAAIITKYSKTVITNKYVSHGTLVELIWTVTPGLILVFIAFTSFKLLYLMDEVSDVNMTFYIEGHQWYWSYQYPDFIGDDDDFIGFDSYLVPESDLEDGALRMLDVDERVILPEVTHARFIVSSGDVIHSYACPALGIKADAYPGRLNQASSLVNRLGTFYGQCSEICGILHSSMPIVIQCITLEKFLTYLWEK